MTYSHIFSRLSEIHSNTAVFVVVAIVVVASMIDISLNRIYSYTSTSEFVFSSRIAVFLILGIVYAIGQYLVLQFVKNRSKQIRALHLNFTHKVVTATQYTLTAIIIFFILEMIMTSSYSLAVLATAIGISYTLAVVMLGILAQRFFSWFRSNRNFVVGIYGLSSAMLSMNAAFTFAFVAMVSRLQQAYIYPYLGAPFTPFITSSPLVEALNYGYATSSVLSFMLTWVATILILRHYSPKLGKTKFWIIVSFPLPYFLIQFLPFIPNLISMFYQSETVVFLLYTFIPTYSKLIGGILFGIAFWATARNLGHNSIIKNYMIISGYGLVLLFVSNQAILLVSAVPYPPFGLATVAFMGLSSYMILIGVYCSAISVSEDSKLRQSIRTFAMKESRLLDSIGMAQMEQQIEKRVIEIAKRNQYKMAEETGIQSSLTEDDMKEYLQQVIKEVKMQKTTTGETSNGSA